MQRVSGGTPNVALLAALALVACAERPEPPERIFLFVVDTLRQDHLSAYGSKAKTPNMDALAARGQRVDRAISAYHQTTMSMGALFTGRTPAIETGERARGLQWNGRAWCGLSRFSNSEDTGCVPANLTTLAERLRDAGYWTAGVASNWLLFDPAGYSQGFDRWEQVGILLPRLGTRSIRDGAEYVHPRVMQVLEERKTDRFFLYVHWMDVHSYRNDYRKSVEDFDLAFGEMLASLEAEGLLENSWIVLIADHGESLGETSPLGKRRHHKGNPSFETELRVPLISVPPIFPTDRLVRTQDVSATLLDRLGLEPLVANAALAADEQFASEAWYQTYRRGRYKSMRARDASRFLLFDLEADPNEKSDISATHPDIVAEHEARMDALTEELRTDADMPAQITHEDLKRLRALGYAD